MDKSARLQPVWVLVKGFPMELWFFHEFSHLFESYRQVPAVDHATAKHTDFRGAQVRVNCYDIVRLPPL
jgi:hypothetical protein